MYDTCFPIVLPRKHHVTKLIVRKHNEVNNYAAGTNHLLSIISNKYWILNTREEIREMEKECVKFIRQKATRATLSVALYARQMQFTWDQIHYLEVRPYQNVK